MTGASLVLDGARLDLVVVVVFRAVDAKIYIQRDAIRLHLERASERERQEKSRRERDKRGGENDAEWSRTRRGSHRGEIPASIGRGVADRGTRAAYAGRGRHKGVDKVAIAHGTQLHAPALLPTNPRQPPNVSPTDRHRHSRPRIAHPRVRTPPLFQQARSTRTIPSLYLSPLPVTGLRAPLGITKRTTPLDSKREISQTTRWQRCSCRELLVLDASTNLQGNPSRRSPSCDPRTSPHPLPPSTRLFPPFILLFLFLFLSCARNPAPSPIQRGLTGPRSPTI